MVFGVIRVFTDRKYWQAVIGLAITGLSALLAGRTGQAVDFYLPAVLMQVAGGPVFLLSILVRLASRPLTTAALSAVHGDLLGEVRCRHGDVGAAVHARNGESTGDRLAERRPGGGSLRLPLLAGFADSGSVGSLNLLAHQRISSRPSRRAGRYVWSVSASILRLAHGWLISISMSTCPPLLMASLTEKSTP